MTDSQSTRVGCRRTRDGKHIVNGRCVACDELIDLQEFNLMAAVELQAERDSLAAENARLREDMKQILGICSGIQDSYTRLLLIRDVASKSPHGE